jgi:hypothetical protein
MIEVGYKWSLICFIIWMLCALLVTVISIRNMVISYKAKNKDDFKSAITLLVLGFLPTAPIFLIGYLLWALASDLWDLFDNWLDKKFKKK